VKEARTPNICHRVNLLRKVNTLKIHKHNNFLHQCDTIEFIIGVDYFGLSEANSISQIKVPMVFCFKETKKLLFLKRNKNIFPNNDAESLK
jgi:hypothetical protein